MLRSALSFVLFCPSSVQLGHLCPRRWESPSERLVLKDSFHLLFAISIHCAITSPVDGYVLRASARLPPNVLSNSGEHTPNQKSRGDNPVRNPSANLLAYLFSHSTSMKYPLIRPFGGIRPLVSREREQRAECGQPQKIETILKGSR